MTTITTKSIFLTIILLCGFLNTTTKIFGMNLTETTAQFKNVNNEASFMELFTKEKKSDLIHIFKHDGLMKDSVLLDNLFDSRINLEVVLQKENSLILNKNNSYFGTLQLPPHQHNTILSNQKFGAPIYAMTCNQCYHLSFPKNDTFIEQNILINRKGESSSSIDFSAENADCDDKEFFDNLDNSEEETNLIANIINLINASTDQLPENIKFYVSRDGQGLYTQINILNNNIIPDEKNDTRIDSDNIFKEEIIIEVFDNPQISILKKYLNENECNTILSYDFANKTTYVRVTADKDTLSKILDSSIKRQNLQSELIKTNNSTYTYNKRNVLLAGSFIATILVALAYKYNYLPDALSYYITNVKNFVSRMITNRSSLSLFKK